MTTLGQLKYEDEFYFQGKRYKQVIRQKKPLTEDHTIFCHTKTYPWEELQLSATSEVKKVIRCKNASS